MYYYFYFTQNNNEVIEKSNAMKGAWIMIILKMIYSQDIDLAEDLQALKALLKQKNINIGLVESFEDNNYIMKVICDSEFYNKKTIDILNTYISNVLYKLVIKQYRCNELYQLLSENFFFLKQEEILEVEEQIMKTLNLEDEIKDDISIFCSNRINDIMKKIKECIEDNPEININGFLVFRTKEIREELEEVIDKIVDRYMVEKEYNEFIKLLKYFVDIQESKINLVNLYVKPQGGYTLKDEEGKDLLNMFLSELTECKIGVDVNLEDVIISGLITSVPKRIIIYDKEVCSNKEFLDTIIKVFGERVTMC